MILIIIVTLLESYSCSAIAVGKGITYIRLMSSLSEMALLFKFVGDEIHWPCLGKIFSRRRPSFPIQVNYF